jgi:hypothetical protein
VSLPGSPGMQQLCVKHQLGLSVQMRYSSSTVSASWRRRVAPWQTNCFAAGWPHRFDIERHGTFSRSLD